LNTIKVAQRCDKKQATQGQNIAIISKNNQNYSGAETNKSIFDD
jgi:hypothetical protein